MFDIEYWCILCGKWLTLQGPSYADPVQASYVALDYWQRSGKQTRVVDDYGQVLWPQ